MMQDVIVKIVGGQEDVLKFVRVVELKYKINKRFLTSCGKIYKVGKLDNCYIDAYYAAKLTFQCKGDEWHQPIHTTSREQSRVIPLQLNW